MSLESFMDEWSKGKRVLETSKDKFYEIRANADMLQECEVLHQGIEAFEDITLTNEHICWLRDQENNIRCCYFMDNTFHEYSFKQLDIIFGDKIRRGGIQNNSQILQNGIEVPIVPPFFVEEVRNKHEQKRRRVLYAQKIKKKNIREMNAMLWFFNMDSAPTKEECHESIHLIPPNIFCKTGMERKTEEVELPLRERTIQILEKTRKKIINHPLYAEKLKHNIFENIESVSDLLKLSIEDNGNHINIAQHIIALYHILFPLNQQ